MKRRVRYTLRGGKTEANLKPAFKSQANLVKTRCRIVRKHDEQGFSLHAEVCCAAHQKKKLGSQDQGWPRLARRGPTLCRYITRPAIANERLALNRAGQVVLTLKTAYREGTTHIVMSPLELLQRLAALVPRPRLHLIRFHGVLAPHARLCPEVIPGVPVNAHTPSADQPRRPLLRRLPA